ncbi:SusC/RagA family TonB-linked outer membrane protein [Chitinophaga sp. CF418]|uniref:SusC/RagA family TonB-linked outer membrane protein n=1 Tax=Chitinophaga sp. CF418 TaxID=1855287 RepID=UPI00091AFC62|nr:SusC/RagA family TonB-linked outer membrane protein [Chitinophaga sp. CF418]SHM37253.1 TonB-linked outer membrane protein, SusC/RagA family [Chitinophaga sp. CF418]
MQQKFTHCYARRSLMALLWLLLPSIYLHAQKSAQPGRNVTLTSGHISLRDVFNVIEKQTGVVLFFGELNTSQLVGVKFVATPIEEALAEMLPPLGLTYEYVNGNRDKIFIRSIVGERKKDTVMVITINGIVTDDKGEPLPGASIRVKGTSFGTATKANGMFGLTMKEGTAHDILLVSYTGYKMQEVKFNSNSGNLKVQLVPGDNRLNETVVTAYGTSTQRAVVGAITVVKGEQIQNLPNRSFDKNLQGLVPGLLVTQGTGQPGGGLGNFVLRGISTGGNAINGAAVRNPLIVIDGIPVFQDPAQATTSSVAFNNPMAQLNPSDIASISVLKDAGAIALYGSKASNGVILVTTKRGKEGKTVFNFRHQTDISSRLKAQTKLLNQQQYMDLLYETYRNTDPAYWTDNRINTDLINKFPHYVKASGDTSFYPAPDWLNELYNNAATTLSHELSMSGGNEKGNFYINLEYTKQNGIEKNTGYNRKSIRINYENAPVQWLRIGANTTLSYNIQDYSYSGASERLYSSISPLNAMRDQYGNFVYNYSWGLAPSSSLATNTRKFANPLVAADLNVNRNTSYRGLNNLYINANFLRYFSFSSNFGVNFMLTEAKEKIHPLLAGSNLEPGIGRINETDIRNANIINTNILRYDRIIRQNHHLRLLLGHEAQVITNRNLYTIKEGITSNPLADQLNIGTIKDAGGLSSKQTLLSYFSQANYDFRNKYFVSGSLRTDGSSLFGDNRRFGNHWSAAAGWIVSAEPFMSKTASFLDYFKLRGSIGSAGNSSAISNAWRYDVLALYHYINSPAVLPPTSSRPGNRDIQWEKTFSWDAGVELQLFKQRIAVTADIYNKKTSQVIALVQIPYATGFYDIQRNIGDLTNKGIEISISADVVRTTGFSWNLSANWSKNDNLLVRSFYPVEKVTTTLLANGTGKNYNSFYMPVWAGVNKENGAPQWIDTTGKISSEYKASQYRFVGKPQPDGFGTIINTFSYSGFDLSVMLHYQYGFKIYNNDGGSFVANDGVDPYLNQSTAALDRWTKPGDVAANPRRLLFGRLNGISDRSTSISTRYLYDGDFIRLSNISLTYNLPKILLEKMSIRALKVYVQGHNLATWTKYSGQDPENANASGLGSAIYPLQRSFTAGINVSF